MVAGLSTSGTPYGYSTAFTLLSVICISILKYINEIIAKHDAQSAVCTSI